jgi:hypothetical protein
VVHLVTAGVLYQLRQECPLAVVRAAYRLEKVQEKVLEVVKVE